MSRSENILVNCLQLPWRRDSLENLGVFNVSPNNYTSLTVLCLFYSAFMFVKQASALRSETTGIPLRIEERKFRRPTYWDMRPVKFTVSGLFWPKLTLNLFCLVGGCLFYISSPFIHLSRRSPVAKFGVPLFRKNEYTLPTSSRTNIPQFLVCESTYMGSIFRNDSPIGLCNRFTLYAGLTCEWPTRQLGFIFWLDVLFSSANISQSFALYVFTIWSPILCCKYITYTQGKYTLYDLFFS